MENEPDDKIIINDCGWSWSYIIYRCEDPFDGNEIPQKIMLFSIGTEEEAKLVVQYLQEEYDNQYKKLIGSKEVHLLKHKYDPDLKIVFHPRWTYCYQKIPNILLNYRVVPTWAQRHEPKEPTDDRKS